MSLVKTTHNGQLTFKNQITSNRQTMKRILFSAALTCILAMGATAQEITKECKERAAKLVEQMTLDEKIDYISGATDGFHIRAIDRLGIPEIRMADGPQGVRNNTKSTLFACGVAAAATWN